MKREFLKELGLGSDVIEKIMAEHGRAVEKIKSDSAIQLEKSVVDGMVSASGAKSDEVLRTLLGDLNAGDAEKQITNLRGKYPWLFKESLPVFSAQCEGESEKSNPFRRGAGL